MKKCDKVITHGGTGAIVSAIKENKKVIAVARLSKYGEHVDDHQLQITNQFCKEKLILTINNIEELEEKIQMLSESTFNQYISNTEAIIDSIDLFIQNMT